MNQNAFLDILSGRAAGQRQLARQFSSHIVRTPADSAAAAEDSRIPRSLLGDLFSQVSGTPTEINSSQARYQSYRTTEGFHSGMWAASWARVGRKVRFAHRVADRLLQYSA